MYLAPVTALQDVSDSGGTVALRALTGEMGRDTKDNGLGAGSAVGLKCTGERANGDTADDID